MLFINLVQTFGSMDFCIAWERSACGAAAAPSVSEAIAGEVEKPRKTANSKFLVKIFIVMLLKFCSGGKPAAGTAPRMVSA